MTRNVEIDAPTYSIQTRCPRMREHVYQVDPVPMPCADCYSIRVTSERLPEWQPEVRWPTGVLPPERGDE